MPDTRTEIQRYSDTDEAMELDPEGRWVLYRDVAAHIDALTAALDNLATHHELERVAGNTHSRPDQCEFVRRARAILRGDQEMPNPLDCDGFDPNNLDPAPGGTTAIRDGQYVRETD